MFPGNVSIVQDASVSGGNAVAHVNITSGINGSYNAITYLLELINKQNVSNGYGPHDLAYVVRETLRNHPVSLVAGASTLYDATGRLNSTWNDKNLSVVTFVQQNSTKNVENANMAPVITLTTSVASNQSTVLSGSNSTITVRIANSSTGAPVPGAVVYLTSSDGSPISPATGVTASDGTFSANFSAPTVSSSETVLITAQVTAAGYTAGSGSTSILVNPVVLPAAASGLTVGPGNQQVSLNWTSPSSGGSGLSYHVYRSDSPTGTFTAVGLSTSTGFVDTGLVGGLSYWYKVSAQNSYGFSPNTTAIPATSVSAASQGLPTSVGWWISIDSMNFSSTTNATLSLFLPSGLFGYQFGPHSYAFLASEATSPVVAAGVPLSITASFTPRYASLQGTVSPSNAAVTLNGVAVSVVNGAFVKLLEAGTYSLNVTAAGYTSNVSTVTMTPGNITPAHVLLQPVQSGNGGASGSNAGLTGNEMIAIIGLAVVGVVAVIAGLIALSRKGKRNQSQ